MVRLSVNVNKVATVRNSRGGDVPSVRHACEVCLDAGVRGITVHPRADARHITHADVRDISSLLAARRALALGPNIDREPSLELNIEGDPTPDWLELVREVKPQQATLVPVRPGELTSEAGWPPDTDVTTLRRIVSSLQARGVRVSVFIDPLVSAVELAQRVGADRVELYTEPYAAAFARGPSEGQASFERYVIAAKRAHELGLGINAGHDLDLANLPLFKTLPQLDEVSIGHALVGRALFVGLAQVVHEYLELLARA